MPVRLSKRVSAEGDTSERFTWPQSVPPLPAKPEPVGGLGFLAVRAEETPEVDRQAARYSIGSPLEEPTVARRHHKARALEHRSE